MARGYRVGSEEKQRLERRGRMALRQLEERGPGRSARAGNTVAGGGGSVNVSRMLLHLNGELPTEEPSDEEDANASDEERLSDSVTVEDNQLPDTTTPPFHLLNRRRHSVAYFPSHSCATSGAMQGSSLGSGFNLIQAANNNQANSTVTPTQNVNLSSGISSELGTRQNLASNPCATAFIRVPSTSSTPINQDNSTTGFRSHVVKEDNNANTSFGAFASRLNTDQEQSQGRQGTFDQVGSSFENGTHEQVPNHTLLSQTSVANTVSSNHLSLEQVLANNVGANSYTPAMQNDSTHSSSNLVQINEGDSGNAASSSVWGAGGIQAPFGISSLPHNVKGFRPISPVRRPVRPKSSISTYGPASEIVSPQALGQNQQNVVSSRSNETSGDITDSRRSGFGPYQGNLASNNDSAGPSNGGNFQNEYLIDEGVQARLLKRPVSADPTRALKKAYEKISELDHRYLTNSSQPSSASSNQDFQRVSSDNTLGSSSLTNEMNSSSFQEKQSFQQNLTSQSTYLGNCGSGTSQGFQRNSLDSQMIPVCSLSNSSYSNQHDNRNCMVSNTSGSSSYSSFSTCSTPFDRAASSSSMQEVNRNGNDNNRTDNQNSAYTGLYCSQSDSQISGVNQASSFSSFSSLYQDSQRSSNQVLSSSSRLSVDPSNYVLPHSGNTLSSETTQKKDDSKLFSPHGQNINLYQPVKQSSFTLQPQNVQIPHSSGQSQYLNQQTTSFSSTSASQHIPEYQITGLYSNSSNQNTSLLSQTPNPGNFSTNNSNSGYASSQQARSFQSSNVPSTSQKASWSTPSGSGLYVVSRMSSVDPQFIPRYVGPPPVSTGQTTQSYLPSISSLRQNILAQSSSSHQSNVPVNSTPTTSFISNISRTTSYSITPQSSLSVSHINSSSNIHSFNSPSHSTPLNYAPPQVNPATASNFLSGYDAINRNLRGRSTIPGITPTLYEFPQTGSYKRYTYPTDPNVTDISVKVARGPGGSRGISGRGRGRAQTPRRRGRGSGPAPGGSSTAPRRGRRGSGNSKRGGWSPPVVSIGDAVPSHPPPSYEATVGVGEVTMGVHALNSTVGQSVGTTPYSHDQNSLGLGTSSITSSVSGASIGLFNNSGIVDSAVTSSSGDTVNTTGNYFSSGFSSNSAALANYQKLSKSTPNLHSLFSDVGASDSHNALSNDRSSNVNSSAIGSSYFGGSFPNTSEHSNQNDNSQLIKSASSFQSRAKSAIPGTFQSISNDYFQGGMYKNPGTAQSSALPVSKSLDYSSSCLQASSLESSPDSPNYPQLLSRLSSSVIRKSRDDLSAPSTSGMKMNTSLTTNLSESNSRYGSQLSNSLSRDGFSSMNNQTLERRSLPMASTSVANQSGPSSNSWIQEIDLTSPRNATDSSSPLTDQSQSLGGQGTSNLPTSGIAGSSVSQSFFSGSSLVNNFNVSQQYANNSRTSSVVDTNATQYAWSQSSSTNNYNNTNQLSSVPPSFSTTNEVDDDTPLGKIIEDILDMTNNVSDDDIL